MSDSRDASGADGELPPGLPADLGDEIRRYAEAEGVTPEAAVGRLLQDAVETWRFERALERLADGEVSFARAAEIAAVPPWELAAALEDEGLQWVGSDHLAQDLERL